MWRSACRCLRQQRAWSWWQACCSSSCWSTQPAPPARRWTFYRATSVRPDVLCTLPDARRRCNTFRLCIAQWLRRERPLRTHPLMRVTLSLKLLPKKMSSSKSPGGKHREWSAKPSAPAKHRDSLVGSQSNAEKLRRRSRKRWNQPIGCHPKRSNTQNVGDARATLT